MSLLLLLCLFLPGLTTGCTTNGMVSHVQTIRVGMGGNQLGSHTAHQYYILFGLYRLNEVNVQSTVADFTSYDVTTGYSYFDWIVSLVMLPFTVSRSTVKIDY